MHFGSLRSLCHEKHSELPLHTRVYKGRVVFRGDIVKDIDGWYAVFSEQGTSSSHMAATKFMDALARCPGNDGEDSDAVAAYTQVVLDEVQHLLGKATSLWTLGSRSCETGGQNHGRKMYNVGTSRTCCYKEICTDTS